MISLQGSIRSLGLELLVYESVDSRKGEIMVIKMDYFRFSDGVTKLAAFWKKQQTVVILPTSSRQNNAVPAIAALSSAFVVMKVGQFTANGKSTIGFASFIDCIKSGRLRQRNSKKCHPICGFHRCIKRMGESTSSGIQSVAGLNHLQS